MHVLVVASTFPAHDEDPVPAFVKDQVISLHSAYPEMSFSVLAPHDKRSNTKSYVRYKDYDEYRFHYFWPFGLEKLAGRGIMPALKANPLNYFLIPFLFIGEFVALLRLTLRTKPDILYAHWFTPQAVIARWVGFFTKTPYVFTTHASDVDVWHKIPLIGGWMVRSNARRARAFTAVSTRSMSKLEAFFNKVEWDRLKTRGAIIPMGVNIPKTKPKTTVNGTKHQTIVFIGRLAEKKGVQYLLQAFSEVHAVRPNTQLVIAGDGPLLANLKDRSTSLGIKDSVSFPGFVSGVTKEKLIASADVYAVPSIITKSGDAEGLPVSLLEGLSYGNICVATYESGADDILTDGKDGFLVPEKDSGALRNAIDKSLALSSDDKRKMSKNARTTAEQFSWQKAARRYYEFLFARYS